MITAATFAATAILLVHAGRPVWNALAGNAIGCGAGLSQCGAAGRMLDLWIAGVAPLAVLPLMLLSLSLCPALRSAVGAWIALVLVALTPVSGSVPMPVLLGVTAVLVGCLPENGWSRWAPVLALGGAAMAIPELPGSMRSFLIPAAGINLVPRSAAAELSLMLRDVDLTGVARSAPFALITAGIVSLDRGGRSIGRRQ